MSQIAISERAEKWHVLGQLATSTPVKDLKAGKVKKIADVLGRCPVDQWLRIFKSGFLS